MKQRHKGLQNEHDDELYVQKTASGHETNDRSKHGYEKSWRK